MFSAQNYSSAAEFIIGSICDTKGGSHAPLLKDDLIKYAHERGISAKQSMTRREIVKLLTDDGVTVEDLYKLSGVIGVSRLEYCMKYCLSEYEFSKLTRAGVIKHVGKCKGYDLYDVYDYYSPEYGERVKQWTKKNLVVKNSKAVSRSRLKHELRLSDKEIDALDIAFVAKNRFDKLHCNKYYWLQDGIDYVEKKRRERLKEEDAWIF